MVVPEGIVTVAGPKLKLSIFTSVGLDGFSPALPATLGLAAAPSARAIPRIPASAPNNLIFFIFLSPFRFSDFETFFASSER
jgi:hypothetical protein